MNILEINQNISGRRKNEFDDIFFDMLGERNAADTREFDDIFGDDLKPKEQIKTEFDDIFR
ncbi:hypothetical protein [Dorea formicigenerans]|uniref:hypothetical protein n=1 Tax=Dorea formicigenerans TaxID=39486 RepID=UPI00156D7525|nr:hypothetical protein [Dorea formicigenerans]NSK18765.1 hypothetical protein [Dorea formicigenerans]